MITLPKRLSLKPDLLAQRGLRIQESVYRHNDVKYDPRTFIVGGANSRMREKRYDREVQDVSLQGFLQNPLQPIVYGVSSQSDHSLSLFFSAYLVQEFLRLTHQSNRIEWMRPYDLFQRKNIPDTTKLLVITGLNPVSSKSTLERVSSLLDEWDNIPRIVSITGEDPITFFNTSLYYKVDRVFFHTNNAVMREVEVL
jgi:hypothetical protein